MSAAAGARTQRPSVIGTDARRFWNLTWTLAATDFKLRFYGSVLGYVWTLARPFMFFGVIYVVFTQIVGLDASVKNYGVYILFALVLFTFFGEAVGSCVNCLVTRENLLRKMRFPRLVIPLSVVVTALMNLVMTLIAVVIFALISGITPTWSWLELPILIALVALLATGLGLLLSALFVRYRDVQPIWDVFLQITFYASLILVPYETIREESPTLASALLANPLASVLQESRHLAIDPAYVNAADAMGGAPRLLVPLTVAAASFLLGLWVFSREAPRIAEEL